MPVRTDARAYLRLRGAVWRSPDARVGGFLALGQVELNKALEQTEKDLGECVDDMDRMQELIDKLTKLQNKARSPTIPPAPRTLANARGANVVFSVLGSSFRNSREFHLFSIIIHFFFTRLAFTLFLRFPVLGECGNLAS